jgi:hypothetical protein
MAVWKRHIGALGSDSSTLVVGPGDVLAHLRTTDAAASTLNASFANCTALKADQRTAWNNFHADYAAFSKKKTAAWSNTILNVLTIGIVQQAQLRDDDAKLSDFESQLRDWSAIAKSTCGLNAPVLPSNDDPKTTAAKTIEHVAIAGAVIVGGGALIYALSFLKRFIP